LNFDSNAAVENAGADIERPANDGLDSNYCYMIKPMSTNAILINEQLKSTHPNFCIALVF